MKFLFTTCESAVFVKKTLFGRKLVINPGNGKYVKIPARKVKKIVQDWGKKRNSIREDDYDISDSRIKTWNIYFLKDEIKVGCNRFNISMLVKILSEL